MKYVAVANEEGAYIDAVSDGKGGFYLRTRADATSANNLDALPLSAEP